MIREVFLPGMGVQLSTKKSLGLAAFCSDTKQMKLFLLFAIFFGDTVSALEEPKYQVIDKNSN
ncbi:MAG: hypothetical protein ACI85X_000497, partial [Woeseiaceae bacterium]